MAKRIGDSRLLAAASYFFLAIPYFGIAVAFLIYLLRKEEYVRFHALQSTLYGIVVWVVVTLLGVVPVIGGALASILGVLALAVWLYLMYQALQGQRYQLPYLGPIAQSNS